MMFIIGLTGGIGSGKTTAAKMFELLGVPVYNSDEKAKYLMTHHEGLQRKIKQLFGNEAYIEGKLNNKYIASIVFANQQMLQQLEQMVHPIVKNDFIKWAQAQNALYVIMENAILFKSGMDKLVDFVILVTSPAEMRIKRVKKRDHLTDLEIQNRINNQDIEEKLLKKSDYVLKNNGKLFELMKKIENFDYNLKILLKKS